MPTLRSDVVRRLRRARGGFVLSLVLALAGCSAPDARVVLRDGATLEQSLHDADRYWGEDGLTGHCPLAQRALAPGRDRETERAVLAARIDTAMDLFPATYRARAVSARSVRPQPEPQPQPMARPETVMVASRTVEAAPQPVPVVQPVVAASRASAIPPRQVASHQEVPTQVTTMRPRNDELELTSYDGEVMPELPPLPPEMEEADESLPPLPAMVR